MHPVIERVGDWAVLILQLCFIEREKMTIVLRNAVVLLLMLIEIKLKLILSLQMLEHIADLRRFFTSLLSLLNGFILFIILLKDLLLICLFSLKKLVQACILLQSCES